MGASWADQLKKKNHHFKVLSSLMPCKNNKPFLNRIVTCDDKWTLYNNQQWLAQWLDWKKAPKHFQSQTCTKDRSWSLFGGLLPIWSPTLSESLWNHYIWEVCSANQWDALKTTMPAAGIGQQKGPSSSPWQRQTSHHTTVTSKVEWIG